MTAAMAAAATSQELSAFGQALGVSRPGTKYPVRGIPHFDDSMVLAFACIRACQHWAWGTVCRNQISRAGNPSLRLIRSARSGY